MVSRSISSSAKLCLVTALVVLGSTASLQVTSAAPAAAATSPVGLFAWGYNNAGQLGDGTSVGPDSCPGGPCSTTPVAVSLPSGVIPKAIAGGILSGYAVGSDGHLYAWGSNEAGDLGDGVSGLFDSTTPVVVSLPPGVIPTAVTAAGYNGYAIGSDGHLYAWGDNTDGELGDGTSVGPVVCTDTLQPCSTTPVAVLLPPGVTPTAIAAGGDAGYAIGSDGHLYAWGANSFGGLGDGTMTGPDICGSSVPCSTAPVVVLLPPGVTPTAIAAGANGSAYAIGSDGHVYAWGANDSEQLGNGTSGGLSTTPVAVLLPPGVTPTAIAAGEVDGYATGSDRHVYAWGDNQLGELGDGSGVVASATPVVVSLPSGVTPEGSTGDDGTAYAIGSDGHLYAWGENNAGQLGQGTSVGPDVCAGQPCSTKPVRVLLPSGTTADGLGSESSSATAYAMARAASPLSITTTSLPPGRVGVPYSVTFVATGGNPPYRWSKFGGGRPPPGLSFSPTGVLSGTPTKAGTRSMTFHVRDTKLAFLTPVNRVFATLTITITIV